MDNINKKEVYVSEHLERSLHFAALLDQISEGMFILDIESLKIIEVNKALTEITGYSAEELKALDIYDLVSHPRDEVFTNIHKTVSDGRVSLKERYYRRKDGVLIPVEVNAVSVSTQNKPAICVVSRDISEKKNNELRLKKIQNDYNLRILEVNHKLQELNYQFLSELDKRKIIEVDLKKQIDILDAMLRDKTKDLIFKEKRLNELYKFNLNDEFRNIFRLIPIPSIIIDKSRKIRHVNDAFKLHFSYEEHVLLDKYIEDFIHHNSIGIVNDIFLDNDRKKDNLIRFLDNDNNEFHILMKCIKIPGEQDYRLCFLIEKPKTSDDIDILYNEIVLKDSSIREMHHRIKSNLQIICSLLDLQKEQFVDNDLIKILEDTQSRIKTIALIHENIYQSNEFFSIDFNDYINSLILHMKDTYLEDEQKITFSIELNGINFSKDTIIPVSLIINELITNTFRHAFKKEKEGKISIKLDRTENSSYTLEYGDDGFSYPFNFDPKKTTTFGLKLVSILIEQLKGVIIFNKDGLFQYTIIFNQT